MECSQPYQYLLSYHNMTITFPLLSLPLELRREIYRHYFIPTGGPYDNLYHLIEEDKNCDIYCLRKCRSQILNVNHQVYLEARDVLYSDTTWHISFNSLSGRPHPGTASDLSLLEFQSRPEFQFIQNITVGVMFYTAKNTSTWTAEDCQRLEVNRTLLRFICEILLMAPNLLTLKLLWHDRVDHGDWKSKLDCLKALARVPERVKCAVFLGLEAPIVHFPHRVIKAGLSVLPPEYPRRLSAQEQAAKADLNQHLKTFRQQYQARSQRNSPHGFEGISPSVIS